jgi:hypothetical protein
VNHLRFRDDVDPALYLGVAEAVTRRNSGQSPRRAE